MLTEITCKAATCPVDKPHVRLTDAGGLYLEVTPNGAKRWFWKYRFDAKEKRLSLGSYPAVKLKEARFARDDARKLLSQGNDPVQRRKIDKATARVNSGTTYEKVAREFHAMKVKEWSEAHFTKWIRLQEANLFPWIGPLPIAEITAPLLLETLRRVAPDDGPNSRFQLGQRERLGHEIVGPEVQAANPLLDGVGCRQDQYRYLGASGAQAFQHFKSGQTGKSEVQDDGIVDLGRKGGIGSGPRLDAIHGVATFTQRP